MSEFGDKPFGLRQVVLTPIAGGASVQLPIDRVLKFREVVLSGLQRGWGRIDSIVSISDAVEFELEAGGISLEAYALMTGRTVFSGGNTPRRENILGLLPENKFPYFQISGRALGEGNDDVWVVIYKAKLTTGIDGTFQDGQFMLSRCTGRGIYDGVHGVWDIIQHETGLDLLTLFEDAFDLNGALSNFWIGPTWLISDGMLHNSPGLGSELLTNGNMEAGNPPTGWSAGGTATLSGAADERTGGAGAQSLNVVRGSHVSESVASKSTGSGQIGWHRGEAWVKNISADLVYMINPAWSAASPSADWTKLIATRLITPAAAVTATMRMIAASTEQGRYDDVSIKKISPSDLFATIDRGLSDFTMVLPAMPYFQVGVQAGAVVCLDSATTPAGYVVVFFYNNQSGPTTTIEVVALVNSAYSSLASTVVSYGAAKYISLIKVGDQLSVFYGATEFGTRVGTTITIPTVLMNNTRHGLFATCELVTFSGTFKFGRYMPPLAASAGEALSVVYGGSSITNSATGYRVLSESWLRGTYPGTAITVHNGSVSGENSCQNYARVNTDYLPYAPDLVVIDIANNNDTPEFACLESLIRDVWSAYPLCRFVLMKTFSVSNRLDDSSIETPTVPGTLTLCQALGDYYGIPVVQVWEFASADIAAGRYHLWDFLIDTVHPTLFGHNLMSSWLEPYLTADFLTTRQSPVTLPNRLY